jgi:hypothetical protein
MVFGLLVLALFGYAYAAVDKADAWHSANEVRVFIRDTGYLSLQEAIDSKVILAGHATTADMAVVADHAKDTDLVDNLQAVTIIDGCTHKDCVSGVCQTVKNTKQGSDQNDKCDSNSDCQVSDPIDPDPNPSTTPYIAVWDGQKYILDNDFMFGWTESYRPRCEDSEDMYEQGKVFQAKTGLAYYERGDILKLQKDVGSLHKFRILEYEEEESFIDKVELLRVSHEGGTELLSKNDLSALAALDLKDNIVSAHSCQVFDGRDCTDVVSERDELDIVLDTHDYVDVVFSALGAHDEPKLLLTTRHRGWRPSRIAEPTFADHAGRILSSLTETLLPGVSAIPGGPGGDPKSIRVFYYDTGWNFLAIVHPRDTTYYTEYIDIPEELLGTELKLRLVWTLEHDLDFVGLVPDGRDQGFEIETLEPTKAYHHRLQSDLTENLLEKDFYYLHTIRGDVVDIEFERSNRQETDSETTYILKSEGHYCSLRAYLYPDVDFDYVEQFWNE